MRTFLAGLLVVWDAIRGADGKINTLSSSPWLNMSGNSISMTSQHDSLPAAFGMYSLAPAIQHVQMVLPPPENDIQLCQSPVWRNLNEFENGGKQRIHYDHYRRSYRRRGQAINNAAVDYGDGDGVNANTVVIPIAVLIERGGCSFDQKAQNALDMQPYFDQFNNTRINTTNSTSTRLVKYVVRHVIVYNNEPSSTDLIIMATNYQQYLYMNMGLNFVSFASAMDMKKRLDQHQSQTSSLSSSVQLLGLPLQIVVDVDTSWGPYASAPNGDPSNLKESSTTGTILYYLRYVLLLLLICLPCGRTLIAYIVYRRWRRQNPDAPLNEWAGFGMHSRALPTDNNLNNGRAPKLTVEQVMSLPEIPYHETPDDRDDCDDCLLSHNQKDTMNPHHEKSHLDLEANRDHRDNHHNHGSNSTVYTSNTCSICLDDYEEGEPMRVLPCKHPFHLDCVLPWLTERCGSCPMCKAPVFPPEEHDAASNHTGHLHIEEEPSSPPRRRFMALRNMHLLITARPVSDPPVLELTSQSQTTHPSPTNSASPTDPLSSHNPTSPEAILAPNSHFVPGPLYSSDNSPTRPLSHISPLSPTNQVVDSEYNSIPALSSTSQVVDSEYSQPLSPISPLSPTYQVADSEYTQPLSSISPLSPTYQVVDSEYTSIPALSSTNQVVDSEYAQSLSHISPLSPTNQGLDSEYTRPLSPISPLSPTSQVLDSEYTFIPALSSTSQGLDSEYTRPLSPISHLSPTNQVVDSEYTSIPALSSTSQGLDSEYIQPLSHISPLSPTSQGLDSECTSIPVLSPTSQVADSEYTQPLSPISPLSPTSLGLDSEYTRPNNMKQDETANQEASTEVLIQVTSSPEAEIGSVHSPSSKSSTL